jgi:hypothetical protein
MGYMDYTVDAMGNPTQDNNFNVFNVDFAYFWQIAPAVF